MCDGAVDLADAGRCHGQVGPVEERPARVAAPARPRPPRQRAMAPSVRRRPAESPAQPGHPRATPRRWKLIIWPAFISTPFISPSSLATSSAVRIANWASSSARRSAGDPIPRTRDNRVAGGIAGRQFPDPRRAAETVGDRRGTGGLARLGSCSAECGRKRHQCGHRDDLCLLHTDQLMSRSTFGGSRCAAGDRVDRQRLVGDRLAGCLVGPVGAGVETLQGCFDPGQVAFDPFEVG